ncbi:hypothetical protein FOA52_006323 [Chlamydomonas sp. UWO 241]|nr:hypothetical protein FOA52_006323 [Chlamydomonas sp. UWO 241]
MVPTSYWRTEYDMEFPSKLGLSTDRYVPAMRPSPATPRSYKQGFVHHQDFEKLDKELQSAKAQTQHLRAHLETSANVMADWQHDEADLMTAFSQEHALLQSTGQQLVAAVQTMQQLMATVERNRELMDVVAKGHGLPKPQPTSPQPQHGSSGGAQPQHGSSGGAQQPQRARQQPPSSSSAGGGGDGGNGGGGGRRGGDGGGATGEVAGRLALMEDELRSLVHSVKALVGVGSRGGNGGGGSTTVGAVRGGRGGHHHQTGGNGGACPPHRRAFERIETYRPPQSNLPWRPWVV